MSGTETLSVSTIKRLAVEQGKFLKREQRFQTGLKTTSYSLNCNSLKNLASQTFTSWTFKLHVIKNFGTEIKKLKTKLQQLSNTSSEIFYAQIFFQPD